MNTEILTILGNLLITFWLIFFVFSLFSQKIAQKLIVIGFFASIGYVSLIISLFFIQNLIIVKFLNIVIANMIYFIINNTLTAIIYFLIIIAIFIKIIMVIEEYLDNKPSL